MAASARAQPPGDPARTSAPRARTGVHYVYLVRHGVYDPDPSVTNDSLGNGLNALGHEQAKLIGARLAALPVRFHRLVSSGLLRAVQTADDMAVPMHMKPTRDAALNECTPTSTDARVMAGEKPEDVALCDSMRVVQWQRYFAPTPDQDTHDVLVCHGNIIRWTFLRALGVDPKAWANLHIGHASLTIIAIRPDGSVRPTMYSDVGHLPESKQTPK
ncbi:MAG TPA: histidine phosphatase family protein [Candidatus Binatia bacterium]|nr:histidine phosphatase family protein [Candidatus Binatia bacterium]